MPVDGGIHAINKAFDRVTKAGNGRLLGHRQAHLLSTENLPEQAEKGKLQSFLKSHGALSA